ncbi:MAG: hypothetical protein EOO84_10975 [Pantoea sp.]|nr:MAG: hypothetical protein EOO84_10975 [Pantoea sp.]
MFTKALDDAKATFYQLHDDVASGKRRLQPNTTCTKQSTTATSSVDDASTSRLTASAQQDYLVL